MSGISQGEAEALAARVERAKQLVGPADLFTLRSIFGNWRDVEQVVMLNPLDFRLGLRRVFDALAIIHGIEEMVNGHDWAMRQVHRRSASIDEPEFDYRGCTGVGGNAEEAYHSESYGERYGRCSWCGKASPLGSLPGLSEREIAQSIADAVNEDDE